MVSTTGVFEHHKSCQPCYVRATRLQDSNRFQSSVIAPVVRSWDIMNRERHDFALSQCVPHWICHIFLNQATVDNIYSFFLIFFSFLSSFFDNISPPFSTWPLFSSATLLFVSSAHFAALSLAAFGARWYGVWPGLVIRSQLEQIACLQLLQRYTPRGWVRAHFMMLEVVDEKILGRWKMR